MNPNVMFSSKSEIWETPIDFFEELDREFHFQTDVCALPENKKCAHYYSPEQDGLKQKWEGVCWCNPPYGRNIGKWVKKAAESEGTVVCLLPARTDTKWFHEYINGKAEIRFVKGGSKNSAPFPSMIVIFRQGEKEDGRVIYQDSQ